LGDALGVTAEFLVREDKPGTNPASKAWDWDAALAEDPPPYRTEKKGSPLLPRIQRVVREVESLSDEDSQVILATARKMLDHKTASAEPPKEEPPKMEEPPKISV
jgi:hypothetical protein